MVQDSNKKKSNAPKRLATYGGGALVIGLLLGLMLDLPGFGTSQDGEDPMATVTGVQNNQLVEAKSAADDMHADDTAPVEDTSVVTVRIDDRIYGVRTINDGEEVFWPTALDEVVQQVKAVSGNQDGVRVRVLRKSTARAAAEQALKKALDAAGVNDDQIYWQREPVD